ncbi:hypothetical protein [Isoalcanivorax beigongshangi]|uniref:Uncharacterized protein n=1 Tax=Isoalcanivorax beigongshangi TaxID=3238810 RepID=A0ABV4AIN6_9GAMM
MLLKYLNELDRAVQAAQQEPGQVQFSHCVECANVLKDYLRGQIEPVRVRGTEIMESLLPEHFEEWMAAAGSAESACLHA